MDNIKFELMNQNQIEESALVTVRAFETYDYMANYIADEKKRRKFLLTTMPIELKVNNEAIKYIAKIDDCIVAVATLFPPRLKRVSDIKYLKEGMLKSFFVGGIIDVCAWVSMDKIASTPCHKLKEDAWYLNLLAVEPKYQNKGIGSQFINQCIVPYVKNNGGNELSLFTNTTKNRDFYVKNGFVEFHYNEFSYKGNKMPSYSLSRIV